MATLDIFKDDAFTLTALTAAIQNVPFQPARLAPLFGAAEGVNTRSVMIESYDNVLALVPVSQRGAPATPTQHGTRSLRSFTIPHLKVEDAILADEVLGVRAFGTESEVADRVERFRGAGIDRLIVSPVHVEREQQLHTLRRLAAMAGVGTPA